MGKKVHQSEEIFRQEEEAIIWKDALGGPLNAMLPSGGCGVGGDGKVGADKSKCASASACSLSKHSKAFSQTLVVGRVPALESPALLLLAARNRRT